MRKMILGALSVAALMSPAVPSAAFAQDWHNGRGDNGWHGDRNDWNPSDSYRNDRHYRERRLGRDDGADA